MDSKISMHKYKEKWLEEGKEMHSNITDTTLFMISLVSVDPIKSGLLEKLAYK